MIDLIMQNAINKKLNNIEESNIIIDKEYIESFSYKIFNYLNGKVNVFNYPATLTIEWAELYGRDTAAISMNPNIVILYPRIILRNVSYEYDLYYNIFISLIHELLHADQDISYVRMTYDSEYHKYIEYTVECESYLFMAMHQKEIEYELGFYDIIPHDSYSSVINHFDLGRMYKRRNYLTHCVSLLRDILFSHDNPLIEQFIKTFNNPYSTIGVVFNNSEYILIKERLDCCPVQQLNQIFRKYIFDYILRHIETEYSISENGDLIIKFTCEGKYIMCKYAT